MRTQFLSIAAAVAALNIGDAQAQRWNDALQFENTNVTGPGFGNPHFDIETSQSTDLAVQVEGAGCGAGNSLPTFTANGIPLTVATSSNLFFGPTNCAPGGSMLINLNQFARESDLIVFQAQAAAMNQFGQKLQADSVRANQGVAMSLAMAGIGDLQSGEHIAFSGNWGTFQGQNGGAVGVAYRLNEHLSVNAGFAGSLDGGAYGGRAGFRIGW